MHNVKLAAVVSEALDALRLADKEMTALYTAVASGKADVGERFAAGSHGVQKVRAAIKAL